MSYARRLNKGAAKPKGAEYMAPPVFKDNGLDTSLMTVVSPNGDVDWRDADDVQRLQELREKQQPLVNWSIDWDKYINCSDKVLWLEHSSTDAYEANKISDKDPDFLDKVEIRAVRQTVYLWNGYRVKACLRAGGMLPYNLLRRLTPQSQWKTTSKLIGSDLKPFSAELDLAISKVKNDGYREAIDQILSGDIADRSDQAKRSRQDRACSLIASMLMAFEAQDQANYKASRGGKAQLKSDLRDFSTGPMSTGGKQFPSQKFWTVARSPLGE